MYDLASHVLQEVNLGYENVSTMCFSFRVIGRTYPCSEKR